MRPDQHEGPLHVEPCTTLCSWHRMMTSLTLESHCCLMLCPSCAGVLPFAKRGDDRGNNLIRLQQMFPRIVAADFQQPLHVSTDCQTLLSRMLTPDPAKRITIGEIMQHPW